MSDKKDDYPGRSPSAEEADTAADDAPEQDEPQTPPQTEPGGGVIEGGKGRG